MSQYPHPRLTLWTAAYQDRWAWMYALEKHYAYLRDTANLLYEAGLVCVESRNKMVMDAFNQFMSTSKLNELAEASFQHHYHYEIWEDGEQVAELVCTGHVRELGTGALLGAITRATPPQEGFLITRYVDFQQVLVGRICGMVVNRSGQPDWHLRAAKPPDYEPKIWS
ncbi:hypothetical protein J3Q00_07650 [Pseudomonas sp. D2-3]